MAAHGVVAVPGTLSTIDLLALDEALQRLSELDVPQAQVVEMRFFGGMALEEIAASWGLRSAR